MMAASLHARRPARACCHKTASGRGLAVGYRFLSAGPCSACRFTHGRCVNVAVRRPRDAVDDFELEVMNHAAKHRSHVDGIKNVRAAQRTRPTSMLATCDHTHRRFPQSRPTLPFSRRAFLARSAGTDCWVSLRQVHRCSVSLKSSEELRARGECRQDGVHRVVLCWLPSQIFAAVVAGDSIRT